ncbi:MAG: 2-C-methyl-D-erythritol 2,4-cyclodiphosphate synthase [Clostridiales bacterium]|nr:2-C-methyl-D-erythritol 2,4-cyclodiphosphate synthase [Clostridiales bacterium]
MNNIINSAVIAAGGSGTRMGGNVPKQFVRIGGIPIIVRTLLKFETCSDIDEIIVVVRDCDIETVKILLNEYKITKLTRIVKGGATRQASVLNGINAASGRFVFIHDAARPFVTPEQISEVVNETHRFGAAALGVPIKDTLKTVKKDGMISETVDRENKYSIQTPQGFEIEMIRAAHREAERKGVSVTDDCALAELSGASVKVVEGSSLNIKLTTPEDIILAEGILNSKKGETEQVRVGLGYDVHRLVKERELILGGIKIPYELGLLGHSDADVLLHSIMDAMLGAAALGDIGTHFPDTDEKWRGADSCMLLAAVRNILKENGFSVVNIDATIIAQKPKLADFIPHMREKISEVLEISAACVSVKATTTEKLGFCGRGEGIAAEAICMIKKF